MDVGEEESDQQKRVQLTGLEKVHKKLQYSAQESFRSPQ